ncbi:hypothetical protein VI34_04465 [Methylophilales bacterium MBRSG12]|uniref:Calcineurin-like phosphoesterase domain-containing protein n=1 Tax=Methylophilales bacterium MBRS-H7 TaxID=1623450 RepID=A0A0H4J1Q1_9PROT|nr:hypothetical protein UZ34_05860 [Methylophilales bacterium MBRSF5]AKO65970.1 hypothetical protein VI33_04465 [Methylophilales bacterium MBRS-H7]AKO67290.1 hypothetical protein VI34_04465 [Methylophilales bacterium MBRSG12]
MQAFDIIGDIHGQALELQKLLLKLGYQETNGIYQHPERKVIFLGDFIDRGNYQRRVIDIVRPMIDDGHALAVMGNHEYNAISFATEDPNGGFLRKHSDKNLKQHQAFLDAYASDTDEYLELLSWFKTLPLWIDLGNLRIIHACWDPDLIQTVIDNYQQPYLTDEFLFLSAYKENWEYQAIETLLKGKEISLPSGKSFLDKEGNERTEIRIKWWMQEATTYRDMFLGPEDAIPTIPDEPVTDDCLINYDVTQPPVFMGHYWMNGEPKTLASNIACVDWSVARVHGKLVAYSWMGENELNNNHFAFVEREE